MTDSKPNTEARRRWWHRRRPSDPQRHAATWVLMGLLLVLSAAIPQSRSRPDAEQRAQASGRIESQQRWPQWDSAWPPLPPSRLRPPRPMVDVLGAYAFAVRHADLLQYIPCYCGCGRVGHLSNVDCYVKNGQAKGAPRWDLHGFS